MNDVSYAFPRGQLVRLALAPLPKRAAVRAARRMLQTGILRDDYIIRLIKQLAGFLARIAGKRKAGDYEAALAESGKAWDDLIGQPPRELVDVIDTPTLAGLLKEPVKMRAAAQLLMEEGRTYAGKGDPVHALICFRRAWELYLEARVIEPSTDDVAAISELARLVPANQLDPHYRDPNA